VGTGFQLFTMRQKNQSGAGAVNGTARFPTHANLGHPARMKHAAAPISHVLRHPVARAGFRFLDSVTCVSYTSQPRCNRAATQTVPQAPQGRPPARSDRRERGFRIADAMRNTSKPQAPQGRPAARSDRRERGFRIADAMRNTRNPQIRRLAQTVLHDRGWRRNLRRTSKFALRRLPSGPHTRLPTGPGVNQTTTSFHRTIRSTIPPACRGRAIDCS
jgi:hypothetical protein